MLVTFFVNLLLGAILPLIMSILRLIESTRAIAKVLLWFLRLFPSFSFGFGLLNLTQISLIFLQYTQQKNHLYVQFFF